MVVYRVKTDAGFDVCFPLIFFIHCLIHRRDEKCNDNGGYQNDEWRIENDKFNHITLLLNMEVVFSADILFIEQEQTHKQH